MRQRAHLLLTQSPGVSNEYLVAPILQYFFTEHLTSHKQVSPRTIVAYRDSFRLLLQFLKKKTGKQPSTLCVDDLDASAILDFLEHLV
jgi:integrase/recombinase XerD